MSAACESVRNAQQEAKRVFEGVDESDEEEEPPPDLMMVFIPVPAFTGPMQVSDRGCSLAGAQLR
jgi:hypothetical protein